MHMICDLLAQNANTLHNVQIKRDADQYLQFRVHNMQVSISNTDLMVDLKCRCWRCKEYVIKGYTENSFNAFHTTFEQVSSPNLIGMHFGEQLKNLRRSLNLGQKEMADRLNIDVSTYSRWEHKERPAAHVVERVSKVFLVDAWAWVREEKETTEDDVSPTGPQIIHMNNTPSAPADDAQEMERLRLLNRVLDIFERVFGKLRGGGGSN
jgi:transcriptional regulator with XRE-family HTH domain